MIGAPPPQSNSLLNQDVTLAAGVIPERPHPAAWVWIAVTVSLLAVVLFLRKPDILFKPQFWAEDGTVFFQQAYEQGFLRTLLTPYAGYLHTLPRLGAGLALLFPLRAAPLGFNLVAFIVQMVPVLYLLSERMGRWIPDRRLRVVAAFLYITVPNSYETCVILVASQWNLALVGLLLLTADPPEGRWGKAGDLLLLVLFSFTGPFSIFLLPCALLNFTRERHGSRRVWFATQAAVVAAGAATQALFIFTGDRTSSLTGSWPPWPELLQILSTHIVFNTLLGMHGSFSYAALLTLPVQVAGLALTAALAPFVLRRHHRPLKWLLYLAGMIILSWLLLPSNPISNWQAPGFGPRYFTCASLWLIYCIVLLCAQGGRLRPLGVLPALLVLGIAIPGDFSDFRRPDTRYADQIAVFETLPAEASFYIPTRPEGWSGFVLKKKNTVRRASPLEGLRLSDREPTFKLEEPSTITFGKETYVRFSGWALDLSTKELAGGVWLEVDGRLFPAVTGREEPLAALLQRDQRYLLSGFYRDIPMSELGAGTHRLSMIVLTHDRQAYYRIPWRFFTVASRNTPPS